MTRIDYAIAACEKIEADGLNGKYPTWAAYAEARDAAEAEYKAAMSELRIRKTLEHLAQQRAA